MISLVEVGSFEEFKSPPPAEEEDDEFDEDEIRFIAMDIAIVGGKENDNTAILLGKINKNTFIFQGDNKKTNQVPDKPVKKENVYYVLI